MKRVIAYFILIISVLSFSLVFSGYYGNIVKEGTYESTTFNWWQVSTNDSLTANIEKISFGQDNIPNDTITITVTNPTGRYLWIRSIYINEENHNVDTLTSHIFDANGYFYYTRIVPPGGFGAIKVSTKSIDLTPKDGIYDVRVITNAGILEKSFLIDTSIFRNPSILNSLTPYLVAILIASYVSVYYHRRFKIPE